MTQSRWAKKESQVEGRVAFIIAIFTLQAKPKQTDTIDRSPRIQISLAIPELAFAFLQWKGKKFRV